VKVLGGEDSFLLVPLETMRPTTPGGRLWTSVDALAVKHTRDNAKAIVIGEIAALGDGDFRAAVQRLRTSLTTAVDDDVRHQYWLSLAGVAETQASRIESGILSALNRVAVDDISKGVHGGAAAWLAVVAATSSSRISVVTEIFQPLFERLEARHPAAIQTAAATCLAGVTASATTGETSEDVCRATCRNVCVVCPSRRIGSNPDAA
jgi:hypothetical protein